MARTEEDGDDEACAEVMSRYRLTTGREAVDLPPDATQQVDQPPHADR